MLESIKVKLFQFERKLHSLLKAESIIIQNVYAHGMSSGTHDKVNVTIGMDVKVDYLQSLNVEKTK